MGLCSSRVSVGVATEPVGVDFGVGVGVRVGVAVGVGVLVTPEQGPTR